MEFKKLSDVDVIVEPTESTNVLIEENGIIKKTPTGAVGGGVKITNAAEVGQTIIVKATDDNGKPVEWESVNIDSLVKNVLTEMGIEKTKINEYLLDNEIDVYEEEGDIYYNGNEKYNNVKNRVKPGDILTCKRISDGEVMAISSYTFPEIDEETGVFVGAEFYDSFTETKVYKLSNIVFPEIICEGNVLTANILLYYNYDKELMAILIDVKSALNEVLNPEDYPYFTLHFEITEEVEYLVLNNVKINKNGVIEDIVTGEL